MCTCTRRCNFPFEKFRCRYNAGESETPLRGCGDGGREVLGAVTEKTLFPRVQIESENRPFVGIKITKLITSEEGL